MDERPTVAALRSRLVERRLRYESEQASRGWKARFIGASDRNPGERLPKFARTTRGIRFLNALSNRPVRAYLLMAAVSFTGLVAVLAGGLPDFGGGSNAESIAVASVSSGAEARTPTPPAQAVDTRQDRVKPAMEETSAPVGNAETSIDRQPAADPGENAETKTASIEDVFELRLPKDGGAPALDVAGRTEDVPIRTGAIRPVASLPITGTGTTGGEAPSTLSPDSQLADEPSDSATIGRLRTMEESAPSDRDLPAEEANREAALDSSSASVTVNVNMREEPENEATILQVLEKGDLVRVVACDLWCEVEVDGQRGFVFKTFVDRGADQG